MIDIPFLKALTEAPSVGTACGPVLSVLRPWFGREYHSTFIPDGFCLFQKVGATPADLRAVFVAHLDEIGGCVYGGDPDRPGAYKARFWGNRAEIFAASPIQAFDYLAETPQEAFPVHAEIVTEGEESRLLISSDPDSDKRIRPYRTAWTFQESTSVDGDVIEGKALDPRVTLYAVAEAVRRLDSGAVGALFVMAEECAMDVTQRAVVFLHRNAPDLKLVVNADVPWINNLEEGRLDLPAIRIFEGRNFISPSFGIRMADRLGDHGVEFHLTAARSGSQTAMFTALAPTLSVALPSDGVHLPRVKMSLKGTERCVALLEAIGKS